MEIRKDLLGNIPRIGDTIVYNPPKYKGLLLAKIYGFAKSGLPRIIDLEEIKEFEDPKNIEDIVVFLKTPKTGFVICKTSDYEIY